MEAKAEQLSETPNDAEVNGSEAKVEVSVETEEKAHEVARKALEGFDDAKKELLSSLCNIVETYKAEDGTLPFEVKGLLRNMIRDPDPEIVTLARKVFHHLTLLKNDIPEKKLFTQRIYKSAGPSSVYWDGIFAVYKPKGWTSADVVRKVKATIEKNMRANGSRIKRNQSVKVGHGGTLDPIAQGILVIGVGSGCKSLESYLKGQKTYVADALLGKSTDTMDGEGKEKETKAFEHVTNESFEEALAPFRGEIDQIPPMYSAIKKNGKTLYTLAREGKVIEREPRKVTIYSLERLDSEIKKFPEFRVKAVVSKGVYIRVLVNDIGEKCGSLAHMTELKRVAQGKFEVKHCLPVDVLDDAPAIAQHLEWSRKEIPELPKPPAESQLFHLNLDGMRKDDRRDRDGNTKGDGADDQDRKPIAEFKVGAEVQGKVKLVKQFGVFVDVGGERDGLLHESKMGHRPPRLRQGDSIKVVVVSVDVQGNKLGLALPGFDRDVKAEEADARARTVCLGGLPEGTTKEVVKVKMEVFGAVENINMGGRLPADVAYVRFEKKDYAEKAVGNPPSFDDEAGALRECKWLNDHLKTRQRLLLLVLTPKTNLQRWKLKESCESKFGFVKFVEFDPRKDANYVYFERGSAARKAKETKSIEVDGEELKIVETSDEHLEAFNEIRGNQEQRNNSRKRRQGGGGHGHNRRGGYNKRRRGGRR